MQPLCGRMDQLPPEILLNIFSRLPIKSLVRFKCISREFFNIIDEPYLASMHLNRQAKNPKILLLHYTNHQPELACKEEGSFIKANMNLVSKVANSKHFNLVCSCNGLLCFIKHDDGVLVLTNPLRQEVLAIPPAIFSFHFPDIKNYGLGFDCKTDTYKIICVSSEWDSKNLLYNMGARVHSLGTNSWRVISKAPPCPLLCWPIFAYGALHWTVDPCLGRDDLKGKMVSFDMEKEEFNLIPHPIFQSYHLVDFGGVLAIVDCSSDEHIEIWMLNDYDKKEWAREYKINIKAPIGKTDNGHIEVVGPWENGEILLKHLHESYISYNPNTDRLRCIQELGSDKKVYTYTGSLISLSKFMTI